MIKYILELFLQTFFFGKANSHCETLKKIEINCIVIKEK